jgi:flagellar biogenesis protein FliO
MLTGWGSPWAQIAALVLGAGALAVHGLKAKTRLGSTVATAGHANPLLSILEDSGALVLVVTAILAPLLALAFVIALVWCVGRWRRRRAPAILAP